MNRIWSNSSWKFAKWGRFVRQALSFPLPLTLILFSLMVWWHEGYWPLSLNEWKYRSLLQRQGRITNEINSLWEQSNLYPSTNGKRWKNLQHRIDERILPLRRDYEAFLQEHPLHDRAMTSYGTFLEDVGETDSALLWWSRAMQVTRQNPALLNNLANYYGHCGQPLLAIQLYEAAIGLNPREAVYHFNLGNMYYLFRKETTQIHGWDLRVIFARSLNQFRQARECDQNSFEYASSYAETFYGINFLLHNRPWKEALAAWEHCLDMKLAPDQRDFVRVHIVRISTYLRDPVTAARCYSEIRSVDHRKLASRLLEKAFPNSFSVPTQI